MTRATYKFVHFTSYLTIAHGAAYWFVKEFLQVQSDYGVRPYFLQSYIQAAHILLSPLLVISFGLLWQSHIVKFYKNKSNKRKSGVTLATSILLMILSGYMIQVIYTDPGKKITTWVHLTFSGLYTFAYLIHHFRSFKPIKGIEMD